MTSQPRMLQPGNDQRTFDIYGRLLNERIVMLGAEVDDDIANLITAQMLYLEGQDPTADIWLYINSPGGSVTAGMAIYDTMQFVSCDIATICMGLAASMGQFLLCAGAEGKRYALPHARIMMHQPLGGVRGQASDIAIQAEQLAYVKKLLAELIAVHTGQDVEQIRADSERDRWFIAEAAKEYGLIDHVIRRARRAHLSNPARVAVRASRRDRSRTSPSRGPGPGREPRSGRSGLRSPSGTGPPR